jgi:YidC/Oxa1 family membrane protein insertase
MSTEKRLVLFIVLFIAWMWGAQVLMLRLGWIKPPPPPEKAVVQADEGKDKDRPAPPPPAAKGEEKKAKAKAKEPPAAAVAAKPAAKAAPVKLVEPDKLVLGSLARGTPYHLRVQIDQKGGGVAEVHSSRFEAELAEGQRRDRPLALIEDDPDVPSSFGLNLVPPDANGADRAPDEWRRLDGQVWEVVADAKGRLVRPIDRGQEVVLRAEVGEPPVIVTRTYRLREGSDEFELSLTFESPSQPRRLAYELAGPHGIPIEGEWYTGTFRDVFVGQLKGGGVAIDSKTAYDVVKNKDNPERYQSLPLAFAGVENQYFTVFLEPDPLPASPEQRLDRETVPTVVREPLDPNDRQKADVSLVVTSRPIDVGPNVAATHKWRIFAGPKTVEALAPLAAVDLASFHKGWQLPILGPLGATVGKSVIAPALGYIYDLTAAVSRAFGGSRGSYGIAIVLLVICVRLMMFPLSRKQAIMAKKMQEIQPLLTELKEKYKDDKERQMREMMALQRKHGVNMFGGCLPALIQIPIFIGLWQALNNSVALRHAPFLWIESLSAPDMLFKFPFPIPLIGQWLGPYFNLLPLVAVTLTLVQTKLFSPPATTPEQEASQKMMKYMMFVMVFMFYKVPAGLVLYIITSSTWSICERLLLPKTLGKQALIAPTDLDDDAPGPGKGDGGKGGPGGDGKGNWLAKKLGLAEKLEKLLEEAAKDGTIRREQDRDRDRNPPRPRPKSPPGRRR